MIRIHPHSLEVQAKSLRQRLAEAYERGDLLRALAWSRQLDALQLMLWQSHAPYRRP